MIQSTISFYVMEFYKQFAAYTTQQLQEFGLSFGMMYFVIYVGKHPGCTPAEMTKNLHLDWGHCQRSVIKLVEDGDVYKRQGLRRVPLAQLRLRTLLKPSQSKPFGFASSPEGGA